MLIVASYILNFHHHHNNVLNSMDEDDDNTLQFENGKVVAGSINDLIG